MLLSNKVALKFLPYLRKIEASTYLALRFFSLGGGSFNSFGPLFFSLGGRSFSSCVTRSLPTGL